MAFVKAAFVQAYRRLPVWGVVSVLFLIAVLAAVSQDAADAKKSDVPPPAATPTTDPFWSKQCVQQGSGSTVCYVQQFAISQQQKAMLLRVQVGYLGGDDQLHILLTVPLGVSLKTGINLVLDGDKPVVMPLETCRKNGCTTTAVLGKDVVGKFLNGKQLVVRYVLPEKGPLEIPVRLEGLDAALKGLQEKPH